MPEVKEIKRYADFIRKKIKDKDILDIKILKGKYKKRIFDNYSLIKKNIPLKCLDIKSKGKLLYIKFEDNFYLFIAHGLFGNWCFLNNNNKYEFSKNLEVYSKFLPKDKIESYIKNTLNHLNIQFITEKGSLFFSDQLSFGSFILYDNKEDFYKKLNSIGSDIMDKETNFKLFEERIRKNRNLDKEIGLVLIDQKIISGIGNYLRSDILYLSKINPFRKVKLLNNKELKDIFKNAKILTWYDYDLQKAKELNIIKKSTKLPSDYNRMFYIYNQEEDIYGHKIIKKELFEGTQKRYIYYVPNIQK
jgi:formamidopyrimidine-DNA glycosylase